MFYGVELCERIERQASKKKAANRTTYGYFLGVVTGNVVFSTVEETVAISQPTTTVFYHLRLTNCVSSINLPEAAICLHPW